MSSETFHLVCKCQHRWTQQASHAAIDAGYDPLKGVCCPSCGREDWEWRASAVSVPHEMELRDEAPITVGNLYSYLSSFMSELTDEQRRIFTEQPVRVALGGPLHVQADGVTFVYPGNARGDRPGMWIMAEVKL